MHSLFRVYQAPGPHIPAYFIESTALNNVDDKQDHNAQPPLEGLTELEPDQAIDNMAEYLAQARQPEVVVLIHGFNSPQKTVLRLYAGAFEVAANDKPIRERAGLVCIGYRWPSERMGQPLATSHSAAPAFLIGLFWSAVMFFALTLALTCILHIEGRAWPHFAIYTVGWVLFFVPVVVALLRLTVYFRDGYRATHYGVPDLVEVIRQLDRKVSESVAKRGGKIEHKNRVKLSFIGHSMGAFVVTNAVRILSDVFSPPPATSPVEDEDDVSVTQFLKQKGYLKKPGALNSGNAGKEAAPEIGASFTLARLVLISPDIPAETLLSNRANFLASSLRRFREAYLFSNGGDEVLRQVSPIANYFSFPTRSRDHGLRLGNTEVLADCYGVANLKSLEAKAGHIDEESFLADLRVGRLTLQEMFNRIEDEGQALMALPQVFTYFDCTYYIENGIGVLTRARPKPRVSRKDRLSRWDHGRLLLDYLPDQKPDVHSGYFNNEAVLARQLIFRIACLGLAGTLAAYHAEASGANGSTLTPLEAFSNTCAGKQIKVVLSPLSFQSLQKRKKRTGQHS